MGNLPTARNTTYGAASPVLSADLDDIQDCIVGAKHPELFDDIGAISFLLVTGGTATLDHVNDQWSFGAVSQLVAPLRIPVGTRITSIVWEYNRGNAGNVTMKLRRRDSATNPRPVTAPDVASTVDNTSGNVWTNTQQVVNHTIAAGFHYWLQVQCDNAAHLFAGAKVGRDRL